MGNAIFSRMGLVILCAVLTLNTAITSRAAGVAWSADLPAALQEKIFLVLKADKLRAYEHEKLTLKIILYMNEISVRDIQYPKIKHDGFIVGEVGNPAQNTETIGNTPYATMEFITSVIPNKAGEITLGPASIHVSVLLPPSPGSANAFFGGQEDYAVELKSEKLTMTILPLPSAGKPPDFHNVVGKFNLSVNVQPPALMAGDPVKLTTAIEGLGNSEDIRCPAISPEMGREGHFRAYPPRLIRKDGIVICEQVLIPESTAAKSIPPIRFSFFDPETEAYTTLRQGPFALKVTGSASDTETDPPKEGAAASTDPLWKPHVSYILWIAILLIFSLLTIAYRKRLVIHDLMMAVRLSFHRAKSRNAALRQAEKLLDDGDVAAFYTIIFKMLQEYLGEIYKIHHVGITAEIMEEAGEAQGMDDAVREKVTHLFAQCDLARYASFIFSREEMKHALAMMRTVLKYRPTSRP